MYGVSFMLNFFTSKTNQNKKKLQKLFIQINRSIHFEWNLSIIKLYIRFWLLIE